MNDLQNLMETAGAYIAAVGTFEDQKAAVVVALAILIENVQQTNNTADAYLEKYAR